MHSPTLAPAGRRAWAVAPLVFALLATHPARNARAGVERSSFGATPEGVPVALFTLTNRRGLEARVMTLGATLVSMRVPDRAGRMDNVTLSLDSLDDYLKGHPLLGSVVGRYANRIDGGGFRLDGRHHCLPSASNGVHIHGGPQGFHKRIWNAAPLTRAGAAALRLTLRSADGDMGYPGTLDVEVVYALDDSDALTLEYTARTDRPTHVNLTQHAYWNLGGAASGDVLGHTLQISARRVLETDDRLIPTGRLIEVKGSALDFLSPHPVGSRIDRLPKGYDHCYALDGFPAPEPFLAARLAHPPSWRVMEVFTTEPGVQLYTANGLDGRWRGAGVAYGRHHGLCLETQHFPNSPNIPTFPTTVLRPGAVHRSVTIHRFSVDVPRPRRRP